MDDGLVEIVKELIKNEHVFLVGFLSFWAGFFMCYLGVLKGYIVTPNLVRIMAEYKKEVEHLRTLNVNLGNELSELKYEIEEYYAEMKKDNELMRRRLMGD